MFTLERQHWIPRPIEEVFAFFADARNLETITPPWLRFKILSPGAIAMREGTRIRYCLHWHRLPLRWLTVIESWNPPAEFVDVQERGPYRLWRHTHTFTQVDGGTRIRDVVQYALPLGILGGLAHAWFVKRDLDAIFDYRAGMISKLLGSLRLHE